MAGPENDGSNKQAAGKGVEEEASIYEGEINLVDYFRVLWKRKSFIFLASVLPALVVGLAVFLWPRDYRITFTYNMGLGEKTFKELEDKFYSTENLEKLIGKFQEGGFGKYAKELGEAETSEDLREFVSFEVSPSYFEDIRPSGASDFEELQKIQQVRGTLLVMSVGAKSEEDIRGIASVFRNNFEQIIPLYSEREGLNSKIIGLKERMAVIEEGRYMLNLQLDRARSTLEKLENSGAEGLDRLPSNIVLQFDNVGNNSAFLPLPYQIQAAETQIINLEEQIRANKEDYDYSAHLLELNEKLLSHLKKVMPSYCTLEQFHSFSTNTLAEYNENKEQLLDYLKAYIKRIENKIANAIPLVERPKIYPFAKGTLKKGAIVFVVAFMLSAFAAFLMEGLKKSQVQAS